jgi:hypothetical protein
MMRPNFSATWSFLPRAATLFAVTVLLSSTAGAQVRPDDWQFRALIYAYLPTISGSTTFPAGSGSNVNADSDKILDSLKFAFMGTLEAQKGRWGAFTDVMYLNVSGSKSGTRDLTIGGVELPAGVSSNASLDIKATVWTLAANYRVLAAPDAAYDVFAGARLVDVTEKLGWEFSANVGPVVGPGQTGSSQTKLDNWDAIVGLKGRFNFGQNREWFIPYYVDIGTGNSNFTWQAVAGIGYAFPWGEFVAAWRYLDYDFKSGTRIESLNLNGPAIGVAFRW